MHAVHAPGYAMPPLLHPSLSHPPPPPFRTFLPSDSFCSGVLLCAEACTLMVSVRLPVSTTSSITTSILPTESWSALPTVAAA
jgi:hypothetical protein